MMRCINLFRPGIRILNVVENNTRFRINENFVAPFEFVRLGHRFDRLLILSAGTLTVLGKNGNKLCSLLALIELIRHKQPKRAKPVRIRDGKQ